MKSNRCNENDRQSETYQCCFAFCDERVWNITENQNASELPLAQGQIIVRLCNQAAEIKRGSVGGGVRERDETLAQSIGYNIRNDQRENARH